MYNKRGGNMQIKAKYQYTHFIYPFVIESDKYAYFIESILKKTKEWNLILHQYKSDEESYDFFLPYMRKFLFPTLFWNKDYIQKFNKQGVFRKSLELSKLSSITFKYNMSRIRKGCKIEYALHGFLKGQIFRWIIRIIFVEGRLRVEILTIIRSHCNNIQFFEIAAQHACDNGCC